MPQSDSDSDKIEAQLSQRDRATRCQLKQLQTALEQTALDQGPTDRISLTHDLDLDL